MAQKDVVAIHQYLYCNRQICFQRCNEVGSSASAGAVGGISDVIRQTKMYRCSIFYIAIDSEVILLLTRRSIAIERHEWATLLEIYVNVRG